MAAKKKAYVSKGTGGGQGAPSYATTAKKASSPSWNGTRFTSPSTGVLKPGVQQGLNPVSTIAPPAARAPRAQAAPRRSTSYSAPNTGGGGGVATGATGTVAAQASVPGPPPMSEDQWLAQDAQFIDEKNSATQDFENLVSRLAQQRTDYELDNKNTLRNLGWENNAWNQNDRLTGYGNAYQNQQNDFASRGMLDSSLYGTALNDLNRGFNQQRDDLATALQNFLAGQATDRTAAQGSRDQAIAAAQRQALQRYAAQNSLGGL